MVLAIAGALTAISVGLYAGFQRERRITAAAQTVNSTFRTARSQAITTNGWYTVVFQFNDPLTNEERASVWIDEVVPESAKSTGDANSPFPPHYYTRKTHRVTTPEYLPEGVRLVDVVFGTTQTLTRANNHAAVLFKGDGTSHQATVHLLDTSGDAGEDASYHTVKLYAPTAKSKIFPNTRK